MKCVNKSKICQVIDGNTVSFPSTSLPINSSIGSAKGLILLDEVWSFVFPKVSGVSRRSIKDSWPLKDELSSLHILLSLRSTLGKFLTLFGPERTLSEHTICNKCLECRWSRRCVF